MISTREIAWLAGLLEGEASFMWRRSDSAVISLNMTDRDVVDRAARIMGKVAQGPYLKGPHKPQWKFSVHGKHAIAWMMTLLPFLGERRSAKVREIISEWKAYVPPKRPNRFAGTPYKKERSIPTCGHPDRRTVGGGLCGMCYMRQWRADRNTAAETQEC